MNTHLGAVVVALVAAQTPAFDRLDPAASAAEDPFRAAPGAILDLRF